MASSRVKSAERALDVLELLSEGGELSAREIGLRLDLPKSTSHHLLNVMKDRGFVAYSASRRTWSLGVAALEIGSAFMRNGHLQQMGVPFLARLSSSLGVVAHLAELQGTDVVYVDKREPVASGVRLVTEVGSRLPAHLTAVGRAVLSTLDEKQLEPLYREYDWPLRTGEGPASWSGLEQVLQAVRSEGVAVEEGSTTDGICCIAAPVVQPSGLAQAAIGIAFLEGTQGPGPVKTMRDAVKEEARLFSARLVAAPAND